MPPDGVEGGGRGQLDSQNAGAMLTPPLDLEADEAARLATLLAYGILDTPPEPQFDDIVMLARSICATPIALVSLVGADRQWFKARVGVELTETPINQSVCAHAIKEDEILVIPDLTLDPRTSANMLVTGEPKIRFYAGAVLRAPHGEALGALCVIDTAPRPEGLTSTQTQNLLALGRQTMAMLQFGRALRNREDVARVHAARAEAATSAARAQSDRADAAHFAQQAGGVGTFEIDIRSDALYPSPEFCRIFGLMPMASVTAHEIEALALPEDRGKISSPVSRITGKTPLDTEYRIRRADDGEVRWIHRRGEFEYDAAGQPTRLRGAVQDVTERKRIEALQDTLNHEISHRIKNTLAMVDAIALQTLRQAADQDAVQAFSRRIQALGRAHDILVGRELAGADLRATIEAVVGVAADAMRFHLNGPAVDINARSVLSFSLLIHELATNAAKYGALSVLGGRVDVNWRIEPGSKGDELILHWHEQGGPAVVTPKRKGFGTRLIESGFSGTGGVSLRYQTEGIEATFRVPLAYITG